MIISVAHFTDGETREVILKSNEVRRKTLSTCYAIPGYDDMPLEGKNRIYDEIKAKTKPP